VFSLSLTKNINLLSSFHVLGAPNGLPHVQVLLLAHVLEILGPFPSKGPLEPLVKVGKNIFELKCTSNLALVRPQPPDELGHTQGLLLGEGTGLGFKIIHFRVG